MRKRFLIDTNVLLHDPESIQVFEDNEVIIPISVLDELDKAKRYPDETGRNARSVIRQLDKLRAKGSLDKGILLPSGTTLRVELNHRIALPHGLCPGSVDNRIVSTALGLQKEKSDVTVVTKDINMRVKCDALGIPAQDYERDKLAKTPSSLYTGREALTVPSTDIDKLYATGILGPEFVQGTPNQFFLLQSAEKPSHSALTRMLADGRLRLVHPHKELWGITPRNVEQRMAMDLLTDPSISLVTLVGRAGSGKAQPLDALVLTPFGFRQMGRLRAGDEVVTPDAKRAEILKVYSRGIRKVYRVVFSDGTCTECCMEHLWHTKTQKDRDQGRKGSVKTLEEIASTIRYGKVGKRNHSIPMVEPFEFEEALLPIAPYMLGLLLGDGSFRGNTPSFSTMDEQLLDGLTMNGIVSKKKAGSACDYYLVKRGFSSARNNPLKTALVELGLWGCYSDEKFIPEMYKYASIQSRTRLLQGLMDTDGTIYEKRPSSVSFCSTSIKLCLDVRFLVESLGGSARISQRKTSYTHNNKKCLGKPSYRLQIALPADICPFLLGRKADKYVSRSKYTSLRYIDRVEFSGWKETQCILVDHPDHLYVTDNFIVTHNTLLAAAAALHHVLNDSPIQRALLSRPIQPLGKDIGYLPGTIDEKLAPWMAALNDNLDLLLSDPRQLDIYKDQGLVQVEPLTYIRGRSIPHSFLIVDECQNLTAQEVKTVITRVGEGSKIVLTGDVEQIDNPYIDFASNGLAHAVERLKDHGSTGHVTLRKGERSELATLASELL